MMEDWHTDEVTRDLHMKPAPHHLEDEQIEALQRFELTAVIAAGLANDLDTPIGALKSELGAIGASLRELAEILREAKVGPRGSAELARIQAALRASDEIADTMQRMTRDFTRFARGGRPATSSASARAAVETAIRYTRATIVGRASLAVRVPPELQVAVPVRTLVRILAALLLNAAQAFTRKEAAHNWIVVTASRAGDQVTFEISDNAGGVPASVRPRLFTPFVSSKRGSLGLGLSVARALAREHGGDVDLVASEPGEACFRVVLPRVPTP